MILGLLRRKAEPLPAVWRIGGADWPIVLNRRAGSRKITLRLCSATDTLRIGAPARCAAAVILDVLAEHAAVLEKQAARLPPRIAFADGAEIPYRGGSLHIRQNPGASVAWDEDNRILTVGGRPEHLPRRVRDALVRHAETRLTAAARDAFARAAAFAPRPLGRIKVADPRGRWGSCAADGTLRFSWRLILAPDAVLTYVAAHEVAHLAEMSHGPRFWKIVAALDPEAAAARAWLKRHGSRLHRVGPAA